jgi:hypothetical protein
MLIYDDLRQCLARTPSATSIDPSTAGPLCHSFQFLPKLSFTFNLLQLSLFQCLAFGHSGFQFLNAFELYHQSLSLVNGVADSPFSLGS